MKNRPFSLISVLALMAVGLVGPSRAGAVTCDPIRTPPHFRGEVPSPEQVLGYPIGSQEASAAEINAYVAAVDAASSRVVSGQFATSWEGRPLVYAIVGRPENVTPTGLATIREQAAELRDPLTPTQEAAQLADDAPAILWLGGNVHGDEESGADADLRILYELADRDDCAAGQIVDNAIVVVAPTQNPDGREAGTRRNHYDFDLNRDWFARTQPETDGKVELLREYPPVLFLDVHEMGGQHYFFPPNKDPIYHEVADTVIDWQDGLYGPAIQQEFDRQHIQYFNDDLYDFFALVYGDTVPSVGFGGNGMTFEKYNGAPISERTYEHYVSQWVSLSTAALHRQSILSDWHQEYVEAYSEGVQGQLEPNFVNDKGSRLLFQVPNERVRQYFLLDDPAKQAELQALVRRLQRMDVAVYRLTEPLAVPDYKPYGRSERATTLPAGTYWIPMAQQQKHWIQGMLNEDTYVAFPYFYDISGWSNPLLFNVAGGRSGAELSPAAELVAAQGEPRPPVPPEDVPRIAVLRTSSSSLARQSAGWLAYLFEQVWHIPYTRVTASEIAGGALANEDVLIATQGNPEVANNALGPRGRRALAAWANAGGQYIGWGGGAVLAGRVGLTTDRFADPHSDIAGALIRVNVDAGSPLAAGVGDEAYVFYDYDPVISAADPGHVVASYPAASSLYVSGFADGEDELGGTAAITDEPVGSGRAVLFGSEPNFRASTTGMQKVLWNALVGPDPWHGTAAKAGSTVRADAERAAIAAARAVGTAGFDGIRLTVRRPSAGQAGGLLDRLGAPYRVVRSPGKVSFLVPNPAGAESGLALRLGTAVRRSSVRLVALAVA